MKIKHGFLALAVAAALGTSGAFAQGAHQPGPDTPDEPHDQGGKVVNPLESTDSTATSGSSMEQSADASTQPSSADSSSQMEQSASISDDQRSRAGEPLSSASASSSMSSDSESMGMMSQAQSDVPPPVDSETVRNIQQALSDQGHQVQVDGIWGPKTHQALMEFQREQNLDASGQLDGETFAALDLTEGSQTASASSQQEQPPQQTASAADQQSSASPESSPQPSSSQ